MRIHGIPEGRLFREISLIWGIPAKDEIILKSVIWAAKLGLGSLTQSPL